MTRSAQGSVTKLGHNYYRVRVTSKTINPNTGKPYRLSEYVHGTRKKADEVRVKLLVQCGEEVIDSSSTLREYVENYFGPDKQALIEQGKFKRKSLSEYQRRLRLYVYPTFEDVKLRDITAAKVKLWLSNFDKPTMAKEALKTLSTVLTSAVYDLKLKENPCKRVKPPQTAPYQPKPLDGEDIEVYRYFFRGEPVEAAVLLSIGGGLNRGEICALNVDDIDMETGEVVVDDAYIVIDGEAAIDTPKADRRTRNVHLPMSIVGRLREILPSSGPVLPGRIEGRMFPDSVSRSYRAVQRTMPPEVPRIPLKDLRHSSLTLAYESGAEALALKDRGGHSNIDTTRKYYVRPKGNRDAEIARAMDAMLDPAAQEPEILFAIYCDTVTEF